MHIQNHAKDKLISGKLALGIGLRQARTVDTGKIMKAIGFDWLFIDMEHGSLDLDTAVQISVAAQDAGITPIVRVPGHEHHHASRVLDGGAQGIVVPHVDDAQTAQRLVDYCKYPPQGHRSVTGALPQINFASLPLTQVVPAINDSTFVVVMIETPTAVENLDSIAAVPGVDCLLVGSNDLCAEMGIPGEFSHPDLVAVYERVVAACETNGIFPGLGGVYDLELMERYIQMGMRFILAGSDLSLMMASGVSRTQALNNMLR